MSHIPNSAMPHAAPHEESSDDGVAQAAKAQAGKVARTAKANPKTSIALGVAAIAGALAAAAVPLARRLKKAAGGADQTKPSAKGRAPAKPKGAAAAAKTSAAKSPAAKSPTAKSTVAKGTGAKTAAAKPAAAKPATAPAAAKPRAPKPASANGAETKKPASGRKPAATKAAPNANE